MSLGTVPKGKVSASYLSIAQKGIMLELLAHVYKFRSPMFGESLLSSLVLHFLTSPKRKCCYLCLYLSRPGPVPENMQRNAGEIGKYLLDRPSRGLSARRAP